MQKNNNVQFENVIFDKLPFNHFCSSKILNDDLADDLLKWFQTFDRWAYTETEFYTQYEFSLIGLQLPKEIADLNNPIFVNAIKKIFQERFDCERLALVDITAHKLLDEYRMGVHNDFIGKAETHRLIIQLNQNWEQDNGGYLMLFNSSNPNDVAKLVQPIHNTGIGFEISRKSFHAVSTVHDFERYTLVYTFNLL